MATAERNHSPFVFADTLIRSGFNLAALDVEIVMGADTPRGSYCRDLLETSPEILDLYALLGVPLQVTLGYPSAPRWTWIPTRRYASAAAAGRGGYTPQTQADWAATFCALAACASPTSRGREWVPPFVAEPHQFPHCGLLDAEGGEKPAAGRPPAKLREQYLK